MDVIALLDEGHAWTRERVGRVRLERLEGPTPCSRWSLRQLLNHMLGSMQHSAEAAAGEEPGSFDPDTAADIDLISDDPLGAYEAIAKRALDVWHAPGVLERTCATPFGPTPATIVAWTTLTDLVVHGWDIARATGEKADIPESLAVSMLEAVRPLVHEGLRGVFFADEVAVAGGTASDRLIAFLGRTP